MVAKSQTKGTIAAFAAIALGLSLMSGAEAPAEGKKERIAVVDFHVFGAFRMEFLNTTPYRPHLPHPVSYRVVGHGQVELVGPPLNPTGEEQILEVVAVPIHEACRRLSETPDYGPMLSELYRLAAAIREADHPRSDV